MNFSSRLMEAMSRKGMNQKELASMADVPQGAISTYCNGKGKPSSEVLYRLSKALSVSMEWLLSGEVPSHRDPSREDEHWKDRALSAEDKLKRIKSALTGVVKKI